MSYMRIEPKFIRMENEYDLQNFTEGLFFLIRLSIIKSDTKDLAARSTSRRVLHTHEEKNFTS